MTSCKRKIVAALLGAFWIGAGYAQDARLIDGVDVTQSSGYSDLLIQFTCPMRYLSHDPATAGEELRIRLVPTPACGLGDARLASTESPPLAAARELVQSMTVERLIAQEALLTVRFKRKEQYALSPGANLNGLRIRVMNADARGSRVVIGEGTDQPTAYAINLESTSKGFDPSAVEHAQQVTGARPYVSEIKLDGVKWYRLRIGPFRTRAEADRALVMAKVGYPRAWLAIADEESDASAASEISVAPTRTNSAAEKLPPAQLATIYADAKQALQHKQYDMAIALLTKLVEQPEYPGRADALEMLGLARERNRQLAHAKAEYEEFLRSYASNSSAERVRHRLRALVAATRPGRGRGGSSDDEEVSPWRSYGGTSVRYQRDSNTISTNNTDKQSFTSQNSVITDIDFVSRRHGERFDFTARGSGGYLKNLLSEGSGDRTRISVFSAELNDRDLNWSARLGRQTRSASGLLGTFDGLYVGYQMLPHMRVSTAYGHPVDSSYDSFDSQRDLISIAADFGTFANAWDFSFYAAEQRNQGVLDRRAVGAEGRYFDPQRTVIGLVDYDTYYQALNSVVLLGVWQLPARWTFNFNVDQRKSPFLTTRNALIGQPTDSLADLQLLFSPDEIRQFAEDRTADAKTYSIGFSHPWGELNRWTFDITSSNISSTIESGGVLAFPSSGNELAYSVQLLGGSWYTSGDFNVLGLRYQTGQDWNVASFSYYTRFPFGNALRIGPRLRADYQDSRKDAGQRTSYIPALRMDYLGRRNFWTIEAGAEFSSRQLSTDTQDATRYYFGAEYRWTF